MVWHHLIDTPATKKFVADFTKRYGKPPENQAWGDYNAIKLIAQTMAEIKSTDSTKLVEHFEKGAKFPLMKTRDGYFRKADHQMMHEMYTVQALPRGAGQEPVRHLHVVAAGAGPERVARADRRDRRRERVQDGLSGRCHRAGPRVARGQRC